MAIQGGERKFRAMQELVVHSSQKTPVQPWLAVVPEDSQPSGQRELTMEHR